MTKAEVLQLKMTATRVRMGIIESTHSAKCAIRAEASRPRMC